MFKIPDWGDDIPKSDINFSNKRNLGKQLKPQKKKQTSTPSPQKTQKNVKVNKKTLKPRESPIITNKSSNNNLEQNSRKRKHNGEIRNKIEHSKINIKHKINYVSMSNIDTDRLDEAILKAKVNKYNDSFKKYDNESQLFKEEKKSPKNKKPNINIKPLLNGDIQNETKKAQSKVINDNSEINDVENKITEEAKVKEVNVPVNNKKRKFRQMLQSHRNIININRNKLRERMLERLKSAQFRYLNEKLYTSSGNEAKELFQSDPQAFDIYHQGYKQQVKKWPVNPLDVIVKRIKTMPQTYSVADLGCGEAELSRRIPHSTRSFDLVSTLPHVEVCDMAHTPLLTASTDVAVYCLALMGTELTQYLVEANRILKTGGHLLIAEVESRFDNVDNFTKGVQQLGFKLKHLDKNNDVFFFMEFVKMRDAPVKKSKLPEITLKPCLYKRR